MKPTRNPFSTIAVRPGAIPYLEDEGFVDDVIRRWRCVGWIGQLVGPHGVGKTSLTMAIEAKVVNRFENVKRIIIRTDKKFGPFASCNVVVKCLRVNPGFDELDAGGTARSNRIGKELWIVDGFERLNWLNRWLMVRFCKNRQNGLLITTHRKLTAIPLVTTLAPSLATFHDIVHHLLVENQNVGGLSNQFDAEMVKRAFETARGNLRDALMILYDNFDDLQRLQKLKAVG